MSKVNVPSGMVRIWKTWPELKLVIERKSLPLQFEESDEYYELFCFDASVYYTAVLYRGTVPSSSPTQAENDAWKAEFESFWKARANGPIDPRDLDGAPIVVGDGPKEEDRKPIVTMSPASRGFVSWICGASDNHNAIYPDTGRGTGDPIFLEFTGPETKIAEYTFIEPIEIHDGEIAWGPLSNWNGSDKFSLGVRIPASLTAPNHNNTGNCNKYPIGNGLHIILPAAGDGAHDLVLGAPVYDRAGTGAYWDVEHDTGVVSPGAMGAKWNLYDFEVTAWLIRGIRMTHSLGVFNLESYRVEYFHPSWKLRWEVEKNSLGVGQVSGWIFSFRRFTT